MANTPIIGKVTVGGTSKTISGGYVNIGGVWKPISKTYVNVNGVWKNAWENLYTWKKYNVKTEKVYVENISTATTTTTFDKTKTTYVSNGYSFDSSTGIFRVSSTTAQTPSAVVSISPYFMFDSNSGKTMYKYTKKQTTTNDIKLTYYTYTSTLSERQVQGSYISDVTSENASAYPTNGKHTDGYWYVKQ